MVGGENFSNMTDKYSVTIAKKILKPKINWNNRAS